MSRIVYATRKSALALAQCRAFIARLQAAHAASAPVEAIEMQVVTSGDRIQDRPLSEVGGKGLFVKEIEEKLLAGDADVAVHSIKDVPGELPGGLALVCVPAREDPRDVLVAPRHGDLASLPTGPTVGTSSLRRAVALRALRPDLVIVPLRGNVDTRLRKVDAGECDAIVLARAGLVRLGLEARATEVLSPDASLPAVGQGALGIEARLDDERVFALLAPLVDVETSMCVAAERGVMVALEGDCKTPLAAFADRAGGGSAGSGGSDAGPRLRVRAFIARPDGSHFRRGERIVPWPSSDAEARAVGLDLGAELAAAKVA